MPAETARKDGPVLRIRAEDPSLVTTILEAMREHELLLLLVRRQISIRYAQTAFGAVWVVLQPLLATAMYVLVFGTFVKVDTGTVPYSLYAFSGTVLWTLFAQGVERGGNALVADERLVTKIYFPRLLLPVAAVVAGLADFLVAGFLLVPMAFFMVEPNLSVLPLVPLAVLIVLVASVGVATLLASLNVRWRDLRQVAPFLVQLLVWATPVAYPLAMVPEKWRIVILLNPVTPPLLVFRAALFGSPLPPAWSMVASVVSSSLLLLLALSVFRKVEKSFTDYI